jgi:N-acetylglucosaminyldiphosphoundecaprenol N-acetyl-beta-D-mannosaminyltransferase
LRANFEIAYIPFMGVNIANVSMAEALDVIESFVAERTPRLVITANVDHLMQIRRDGAFRAVYDRADLVTCDSIPLKWALAFLGTPVKNRVAGADMIFTLAERAAQKGLTLFLLGAATGVAESAAAMLRGRYPGLKIAGTYSPPIMPLADIVRDEETARRVREAAPDIILVAFGAPKQELWLDAVRDKINVPVGIGVGAAFDFVAGTVKRAPVWVQKIGLEWLHRLFQEPRRLWRRYLFVDSRFVFHVLKEKIRGAGRRGQNT